MIVGVLLGAGTGSRFGGGKLLAPLRGGTPVGVLSARNLRDSVDRGVAVVRPEDLELAGLLEREGFEIARFARAGEGMGASLAFGVASAPEADGWLVALADMPFVRRGTVESVCRSLREGAWIAAPCHRGRRGHPVGFCRALFPELVQLRGERGARALLSIHAPRIEAHECDDPGILFDIDTPTDLSMNWCEGMDKK